MVLGIIPVAQPQLLALQILAAVVAEERLQEQQAVQE